MLLIKSLLVLCAATAVLAKERFNAVASIGYLSGYDISDQDATGYPVFHNRKNRGSAVASIVQHIANRSDFLPAEQGLDVDPASYTKFIYGLVKFPALKKTENQIVRLDLTGTPGQLVEEVDYILSKVIEKDEDYPADPQIAENFRKLVPKHLKYPDQNRWILNQVAIHKVRYQDKLRVEITRVTLWVLEQKKSKEAYIPDQVATLSRDVFTVDTQYITDHAEELADKIDTVTVEQALSALTTKNQRREGYVDDDALYCPMEEEKKEYEFYGRSRFQLQ